MVGIGGSATNDGGCGMAQAIGVRFFDTAGTLISEPLCGAQLQRSSRIDIGNRNQKFDTQNIVVLCDVTNPFAGPQGAAFIYAPQKGASPDQVKHLDDGLKHLACVVQKDLGIDLTTMPCSRCRRRPGWRPGGFCRREAHVRHRYDPRRGRFRFARTRCRSLFNRRGSDGRAVNVGQSLHGSGSAGSSRRDTDDRPRRQRRTRRRPVPAGGHPEIRGHRRRSARGRVDKAGSRTSVLSAARVVTEYWQTP